MNFRRSSVIFNKIYPAFTLKYRNVSTEDCDFKNLSIYKRGTGGRNSFNGIVATVFGCTGFLGRYVCTRLGRIGTQMIFPYRCDNSEPFRLKVVGDLGQVYFHPFNLRDEESLHKVMRYSNVVINLIGRDWETRNFSFEDVHVTGCRTIARVAKESGVAKLIHSSSLNANENPKTHILKKGSQFLRTKAWGEEAVLEEFPNATIFRPADMYGQEDRFLKYYMHVWRHEFQTLPLWDKGEKTEKQPVYVGDVAAGVVAAVRDPDSDGKIYQAVGPKRYLLSELVDYFHRVTRRDEGWGYKRINMKHAISFKFKVALTEKCTVNWPFGSLSWDKIEREHLSDEIDPQLPTLWDLGVDLTTIEDQVPYELRPWIYGQYYGLDANDPFPPATPPNTVSAETNN